MDRRFLKSLFISILAHSVIFLLLFFINISTKQPVAEVYREVSFVVERDFPEMLEDSQTSLAQEQEVKKKEDVIPKEMPPKPKEKVEQLKNPAGKTKQVELPTVRAKQPEPKVPESVEQKKEDSASKIFIPEQKIETDKKVKENIVKDIPGGDFGDSVVDMRPSRNLEIFGPIVNRSIVYSEIPDYPDWAKRQGIESEVRMKFWVEPSGEVVNIDVIQKSGYLRLDLLAKNSLAKWKFTPLDSKVPQIKQWGEIIVRFVLY
jgi:protein TonB